MCTVQTIQAIVEATERLDYCKEKLECGNSKKYGALAGGDDMTPELQQQMLLRLYDASHNEAEAEKGRQRAVLAVKLRKKRIDKCALKLSAAITEKCHSRVDDLKQCLLGLDKFYFDVSCDKVLIIDSSDCCVGDCVG